LKKLAWSPAFKRAFARYVNRHPQDRDRVTLVLRQLTEDPFMETLDTHKLKGALSGLWSCSAAYDCRIVFKFKKDPDGEEVILLVDIGTHTEVY